MMVSPLSFYFLFGLFSWMEHPNISLPAPEFLCLARPFLFFHNFQFFAHISPSLDFFRPP